MDVDRIKKYKSNPFLAEETNEVNKFCSNFLLFFYFGFEII